MQILFKLTNAEAISFTSILSHVIGTRSVDGENMVSIFRKIYHKPVLSQYDLALFRSPGPGLGNLLFPISRAIIASSKEGEFIFPTIRQIKIGTFLRGESDKRTYGNVFHHRSLKNWTKIIDTATTRKISEDTPLPDRYALTIRYKGLKSYFYDLMGYDKIICNWIATHAREHGFDQPEYDIAIHIRWGDFQPYKAGDSSGSIRQPLDWYRAAINFAIESRDLRSPKIVIFSDQSAERLGEFVKDYGAVIDESPNALSAMTHMSRAKLIIASRSTFTMWGAFLGQCDVIWDEAFDYYPYWPHRDGADIKFHWDSSS